LDASSTYHYVKIPTSNAPGGSIQENLINAVPLGIFTAQNSLATPFRISSTPNGCGHDGTGPCNYYDAFGHGGNGPSIAMNVSIPHVTQVYTLMNAYSPVAGAQLATIQFFGSDGATDTFPLVAGRDIRDYYYSGWANGLTNGIPGVRAVNAFTCVGPQTCLGSGGTGNVNTGGAGTYLLDEQQFSLNPAFKTQDLVRIVVTNTSNGSGTPILLGITAQAMNDSTGGQQQAGGAGTSAPTDSNQVALTPDVKQAIAEEVKSQIGAEQAAAGHNSSSAPEAQPINKEEVPPALDPARRTFMVSTDLAVSGADGQECSLTQGDVIMRMTDTPDADQKVNASVSSSKKKDCAAGKLVAVSIDDLQEMRNHFEEQLDAGMKSLASKQGTGKMPKAPDTSTTASAVPTPPPDTNAAKDLQEQQAAADQTEAVVKSEASSTTGGGQL
jgi:hypothetical protein